MVMGAGLRAPSWAVSYRLAAVLTLAAAPPARLVGAVPEVSCHGAGDHPTGADAASAPVPACTARVSVPPIRTLLTAVSAPAMVRN